MILQISFSQQSVLKRLLSLWTNFQIWKKSQTQYNGINHIYIKISFYLCLIYKNTSYMKVKITKLRIWPFLIRVWFNYRKIKSVTLSINAHIIHIFGFNFSFLKTWKFFFNFFTLPYLKELFKTNDFFNSPSSNAPL